MNLFRIIALLGFLVTAALGVAVQKQVVITYPENTPDSVLNQAKEAIIEAGGSILHEYRLIKGFAAKASVKALETVHTLGENYSPWIEDDIIVTADGTPST